MPPTAGPNIAPTIARGGASDVDRPASEPSSPARTSRLVVIAAVAGTAAWLLALLATIPAALVVPASVTASPGIGPISGTVWHGEVAVADDRAAWRFAPLRSIANLAFAADIAVTGPRTDLAGRMLLASGGARIDTLVGRAGSELLHAAVPGLPFTCDLDMQIALPTIDVGDGIAVLTGEVRTTPGTCTPVGGTAPAAAIPALYAAARSVGPNSTALSIAPMLQRRRTLVTGLLARDGALDVTITPAGAATLPFASPPGGLTLHTRF